MSHTGWTGIDWDAPRPDWAAVRRSHELLNYEPLPGPSAAAIALLDALRTTHINGGALFGAFRVVGDDSTFRWFAARNRFAEYDFFPHFLGSSAVRDHMRELQVPEPLGRALGLEESWSGTFTLGGELAATLVHGGAYEKFNGAAQEAQRLASEFVEALVSGRHDDFKVHCSHTPWTPWFRDVAWDSTYVLIDTGRAAVFVLCITDTD